ncbi:MAG: hypothetical protein ABFC12_04400 [Methanobacterium sp.]
MKQKLKGITETILIPLWARARETKIENPIIRDENGPGNDGTNGLRL